MLLFREASQSTKRGVPAVATRETEVTWFSCSEAEEAVRTVRGQLEQYSYLCVVLLGGKDSLRG